MAENFKAGEMVVLTAAYERHLMAANPLLRYTMSNRLAKIEEIFDWESPKGKKIKAARLKTNAAKWSKLPLEDCRYVLSIYYPELKGRQGQNGVAERGMPSFSKDPETGEAYFIKVPEWMVKEIQAPCMTFDVKDK